MDNRLEPTTPAEASSSLQRALYWCAVAALVGVGIWIVTREMPNPDFDKAMLLRGQLALLDDDDEDERADLMHDLQQTLNHLDQESRSRVMRAMDADAQRRRQRAIDRFFELPVSEQVVQLDRRIDEMEARRQYFEQLRREAEAAEAEQAEADESPAEDASAEQPQSPEPKTQKPSEQDPQPEVDPPLTAQSDSAAAADAAGQPQQRAEQSPPNGDNHHGDALSNNDHPTAADSAPPEQNTEPERPRYSGPRFGGRYSTEHLTPEERQRREEFYRRLDERRRQRGLPDYSSHRRL
jgi:hypothetical protein